MRTRQVVVLVAVAGAFGIVASGPARADVVEPPGACEGTASFRIGTAGGGPFTISSAQLDPGDVVTVPLSDTVDWTGRVNGVTAGTSRTITGFVKLDLPFPFPDATIDSWSQKATETASSGAHEYELPAALPRGTPFRVFGEHWENDRLWCSGAAQLQLEGGAFSSPVTVAALGLTALSAVGLVVAGFPKFRRVA